MIIRSAQRRLTVRVWIVAVLLDVVVAAAISHFLSDPEQFWMNTFWIWLGLQVVGIILTLLGVLRLFVAKWAGALRPVQDAFLTALEANGLPVPKGIVYSVDNYLSETADADDIGTETRLAAAVMLGIRQGLKECAGVVRWMMIDSAHEEALKEYGARRR